MKTLLPKLVCIALIVLFSTQIARAACTASFTKSVSGLTVTFTNTSSTTSGFPAMMMYNWNFGDATSSTLKNPVKTYSTPGLKIVTLMINDSFGCTQTIIDSVFLVSSSPTCAASYTKTISGLSVTFTSTSTTSGTVPSAVYYNWNFSDGSNSTLKNPVKTFATGGMKTAQLTIYDSSTSCYAFFTDSFMVTGSATACAANFTKTINNSSLMVTLSSTLSVNSIGTSAGLTRYWYFSDGTSSGPITSPLGSYGKAFSTIGVKWIRLEITDTYGCTSSQTDTFILTGSCNATFTKSVNGLAVTLNNLSHTNLSIKSEWFFSDGTTTTIRYPVKFFATPGLKTIQLNVIDTLTGCTSSKTDSVLVYSSSTACYASFYSTVVAPLTMRFNSTSTNSNGTTAVLSYTWAFSDGTRAGPFLTPTYTYSFATPGIKWANLIIHDSSGCTSSQVDTFMVSASACGANFTKTVSGLTTNFTNTSLNANGSSTGLSYYWYFSDGTSSTLQNPSKTFTSGGLKTVSLTISDSVQGCFSSKTDTFVISAPAACSASFIFPLIAPLTIRLTSTSTNGSGSAIGLRYIWTFSDGVTAGPFMVTSFVKTFATPGVKWARLDISDSLGCTSSRTDSFMLSASSCAASFTKAASGLSVTFNNTSLSTNGSSTGLTYLWNFGDGTTSTLKNPVKTFATGGVKIVHLAISDSAQGCYASTFDSLFLTPPAPLCSASFSLAIDTTTPFHFFLLNTSIIRSTSTFFWSFGDGGTSTLMTPTHTYASFGRYYVCLTVADSLCTSTYCDSIGMDSTGRLLKGGAFGFQTIDQTTLAPTTGMIEVSTTPEYSIYPNPTSANVHIDFTLKAATPVIMQVTDITGKAVYTQTVNIPSGQHTETIDIGNVKPSIYFLNITSPDGSKNYKLIKN